MRREQQRVVSVGYARQPNRALIRVKCFFDFLSHEWVSPCVNVRFVGHQKRHNLREAHFCSPYQRDILMELDDFDFRIQHLAFSRNPYGKLVAVIRTFCFFVGDFYSWFVDRRSKQQRHNFLKLISDGPEQTFARRVCMKTPASLGERQVLFGDQSF